MIIRYTHIYKVKSKHTVQLTTGLFGRYIKVDDYIKYSKYNM